MAIPTYIEAANAIAEAPQDTRIAALKHLKNSVIGHQDKKEELVRHGILEQLVRLLQETSKSTGKRKDQATNGHAAREPTRASFTRGDDVRLQAILLLNSFAQAGPAFIPPLLASQAVPSLLDAASIPENHIRISTAALKALNKIAEVAQRGIRVFDGPAYDAFTNSLYTYSSVRAYSQILADVVPNEDRAIQTQTRLLCNLVHMTCNKDQHRNALVAGGVLDILSARLSAHYTQIYPSDHVDDEHSFSAMLPTVDFETLPYVLAAIKSIVTESNYRIIRLLTSPLSRDAFALRPASATTGSASSASPAEQRLPHFPSRTERSQSHRSKNFPTLGALRPGASSDTPLEISSDSSEDSPSSGSYQTSLMSWLLATIKGTRRAARTQAAALLALLNGSDLFPTVSPRLFSNIIVPYMYETVEEPIFKASIFEQNDYLTNPIDVLAQVVGSNSRFQKAAHDSGISGSLYEAMRVNFNPFFADPLPWSPRAPPATDASLPSTRRLGHAGLSLKVHGVLQQRETLFNLLAAMSTSEDEFRKPFYDNGTTHYLSLGLKPLDEGLLKTFETTNDTITSGRRTLNTADVGNTIPVLRAACRAAQMMSRSVALLRTALTDAKLAQPIVNLLKHDDMKVRKAASDVAINITNETSPMREDLITEGIGKLLVDHAHSADPQLRIRSLWAIKNLTHRCPKKFRATIFEDLEPGWIAQTIIGSDPLVGSASREHEKWQGLQDERMTDVAAAQGENHFSFADDYGATALSIIGSDDHAVEEDQATSKNRSIIERVKASEEQDRQVAVINTEIDVQRHATDALRNIMVAYDGPDMLDTVFSSIGNNEIFQMFSRKLHEHMTDYPERSEYQQQAPLWGSTTPAVGPDPSSQFHSGARRAFTSTVMLQSTIMALTHITAGAPRYRQMVLSQSSTIMQPLMHLLSHPEPLIRVAVTSVIVNLAWIDDSADLPSARQRSQELLRQGFVTKMGQMQDDPVPDIQQRVKVARLHMQQALDSSGRGAEQLHTLEVPGDMSMGSARRNR